MSHFPGRGPKGRGIGSARIEEVGTIAAFHKAERKKGRLKILKPSSGPGGTDNRPAMDHEGRHEKDRSSETGRWLHNDL